MKIGEPILISSLPPIPWKNGGGITRNLAVEPDGAGFDEFLWRLSFAEVSSPGKFSTFPGVDRTILVWKGTGLHLHRSDGRGVSITRDAEAYSFRGEDEIEATLIDGPTIDFNVMVRRDRYKAHVSQYQSETTISRSARQGFFICTRGYFRVHFAFGQEYILRAEETLPVSHFEGGAIISPEAYEAAMIVVLIDASSPDDVDDQVD
ncbi:MAG TPA: HutD family protein [Edaphobacter sp.]|jgi:environmental stress-induced protein Ves|nr:HutD family protein [Edaphobacter sp.]